VPCEEAIEKAKAEEVDSAVTAERFVILWSYDLAVTAGAIRETVQIIDMEDEALAYYPGNTSRLKIRVAGGLRSE